MLPFARTPATAAPCRGLEADEGATRIDAPTLLQRVAAGEMAAMQECMETYGGLVWSLARRMTISPTDAEDAVQEIFIALWSNAERFDPDQGGETTFVAMIARRRLIDRGRRTQRQRRLLDEVREQEAATPDVTRPPSADTVDADLVARAHEAMEQLSPGQQRVLDLAIHRGLTHEEIARTTGMPLGTVKTNARRGLMRVRALLAETDDRAVESSP